MRKRWTAQTEVTDTLLKFREKRKWQIALRRYVLEKNKSSYYAPYFGLDIQNFRNWIELQFDETLNWGNFSSSWQFEHLVPLTYFDFSDDSDLKLCWNFLNIRIEKTEDASPISHVSLISAKSYFLTLFESTQYEMCRRMVEKIARIEEAQIQNTASEELFINANKEFLHAASDFNSYEFDKLNEGIALKEVLAEKDLLKKFGGT